MGRKRRRRGGEVGVSGGGDRVKSLLRRDWRGIRKREMVGKERRALLLGGGRCGFGCWDMLEDERSVVRRTESSGTWWATIGPGKIQNHLKLVDGDVYLVWDRTCCKRCL